jgi:hypothetical protein
MTRVEDIHNKQLVCRIRTQKQSDYPLYPAVMIAAVMIAAVSPTNSRFLL